MTNQELIQKENFEVEETPSKEVSIDQKNFNQLKQELATALADRGLDMTFIATKLNEIIEKAYIINNKWDQAPDFKTMLEATKILLKIYWFDLSDKKTQIAVFNNIPAKWEKLNY